VRFEVAPEEAGLRLDQLLAARIPELSRRKARVLLDIGGVFVDRARVKVASRKVRSGQAIEANLGGALERASKGVGRQARARDAASLPGFRIVHEDRNVIVVDKPAGLLAAPTPESDLQNLAALLGEGRDRPVYVVHRIDLFTSGLLVYAKTEAANRLLSERFREHDIEREYLAVVDGRFPEETREVNAPVGGRRAVTRFEVRERFGDVATSLGARLETGRTHQIRIHCQKVGHPVLGDAEYGRRTRNDPPRMALHAARLGFPSPGGGEPLRFTSPWPEDLQAWLDGLRAAK
jgi:23S rRNA pseudouridine1911/1915/1917 synthase